MSRQNAEVDELFEVKNSFYIGNYQHCINEAVKFKKASLEKDIFMYRAYIAQHKYRLVLDEIRESNDTPLLALRYLAEYYSNKSKRNQIVEFFEERLKGDVNELDVIWIIVGAMIFCNEGNYEGALKVLHGNFHLECLSLQLHCLLHMYRVDLAKKTLQTMQEKDEDSTLTQLCQAWLNIQIGGEKLQDAFFIFQDFCDKFSPSVLLLNGQAVCHIGQQKYDDAENVLRECLNRDPNNYDTLTNLMFVAQQKERTSGLFNRYLNQIMDEHQDSEMASTYKKRESEFDRLAKMYGPSVTTPAEDISV